MALLKSFDVLTEKIQYFILELVGGVSTFEIRDRGGGGVAKSLLRNVWTDSDHTSMPYNRKQFNTTLYCRT